MTPTRNAVWIVIGLLAAACGATGLAGDALFRSEVDKFLARYEDEYARLHAEELDARWLERLRSGPDGEALLQLARSRTRATREFTGSLENLELSRGYLKRKPELPALARRSLERIQYLAGDSSRTVADLVSARIQVESALRERVHGARADLDGRAVRFGEIDHVLETSDELALRRRAWHAASAPDPRLRADVERLVSLQNESVRALGHRDANAWSVAPYDLSPGELARRLEEIERELRPLYAELHTYARIRLARRFGQPVPDFLPAHWLPTRFGQDWCGLEGDDPDDATRADTPRALAERVEGAVVSLGFEPLSASFWDRSQFLEPSADPRGAGHATAEVVNVDLRGDVRALAVLPPGAGRLAVVCRLIGDAHAAIEAARPELPIMLRRGASPALHAAVGEFLALAAPRAWRVDRDARERLLREALQFVVPVIWSVGTAGDFERELRSGDCPSTRWNSRFWDLALRHQGVVAPEPRDERWCDPLTLPEMVLGPGRAIDRGLAIVLAFQLHDHVSRNVLDQDPRQAEYAGRAAVGGFLRSILRRGSSVDWRVLLREKTGYDVSARAMAEYFEPLRAWLVEQNAGRPSTLPKL